MKLKITQERLVSRLLDVIAEDIVPLTQLGVGGGNKVFGAAIVRKDDLSLVLAETNNETDNPLWHGEVHALKRFYEMPAASRPVTKDCIFVATHEPCSLCLSAITWSGFDNFYYLFGYTDTKETFHIPHDLRILKEVFGINEGKYARKNAFWTCHDIRQLIQNLPEDDRKTQQARTEKLAATYAALSNVYQASKGSADIPLC